MNANELGNPLFASYLQDDANFGRLTFLDATDGFRMGLVKVAYDERFSGVLGRAVYAPARLRDEADYVQSSVLGGIYDGHDGLAALGLYDAKTGELYAATSYCDLRHLVGREALESSISSVLAPFSLRVNELIKDIANDPANKDRFVAASLEAGYETYIPDSELKELFVNGMSADDVLSEPIAMNPFKPTHPVTALMDYLRDPDAACRKAADAAVSKQAAKIGNKLLHRDALASACEERLGDASPSLRAAKALKGALDEAFPGSLPNKLWLTVAKDGKRLTFQYPADQLEGTIRYRPDTSLYDFHILPVAKREEAQEIFGLMWHGGGDPTFRSPEFHLDDIVAVSYRGKAVFEADPEVLARRLAKREIDVSFFSPGYAARGLLWDSRHNFQPDAAVFPEEFSEKGRIRVCVGENSDIQTICSDAIKQAAENGIPCGAGDLIAMDGQAFMLDSYVGAIEMPFGSDELARSGQDFSARDAEKGADLEGVRREIGGGLGNHEPPEAGRDLPGDVLE